MMIKEIRKVFDAFSKLRQILSKEQKIYCIIVFVMSLIAAFLEILGVSIVLPLLQAILSIEELMKQPYALPFINFFGLNSENSVIGFSCISIIIVYILKNAFSIFFIWTSTKFANKIRRELAVRVLSTYMKQDYNFFVNTNSSKMMCGIGTDVGSVQTIVAQLFTLISRGLTIICIAVFVIAITPYIALLLMMLIAICFIVSQLIFKKPMKRSGEEIREYAYRSQQAVIEAIQGSKEVLVTNRQEYFVNEYLNNMIGFNNASVTQAVGSSAPSYLIEAICITGIIGAVAFQAVHSNDLNALITQLTAIVVAAFRILPSLGGILGSVNSILANTAGLNATYENLIELKKLENNYIKDDSVDDGTITFKDKVEISHISFAYKEETGDVLKDLCMIIHKGTSIGLIGNSGAGKTTLADIILALYKPQKGEILMDGMNLKDLGVVWHRIIGYVPQSIYLMDSSIRRNVAFGIAEEDIDDDKVWNALEMAQMKSFVKELPKQLDTYVGEWGVQLSGGQRQRIAIARALYNNPDIIVMDEATAALDNETEKAVMESIEALQGIKTLIIVAHRLTTIRKCDEIYEIVDGKAVRKSKEEVFGEDDSSN